MRRLSVIIPTLNEQANVVAAVVSAHDAGAAEVIVADGGSGDRTAVLAAEAGARVIGSAAGRGVQLNAGAADASGDVLLFLHADCRLAPTVGRQIADALRDPTVAHGAFRQRIETPGLAYRLLEAGNAWRAGRLAIPYGDQALFVRRSAFDQVGGFPNEPLMEDVAIARRLRRVGRPVLLEGPLTVSPRRWRERGVVRQTLKNWGLLAAWSVGAPPRKLAAWYKPATGADAGEPPRGLPAPDRPTDEAPPAGARPLTPAGR